MKVYFDGIQTWTLDGGPGSGNFGHAGVPGQQGGSAVGEGGGGESGKAETFSLSFSKMKANPIPKDKKKEWAKNGGVNNPEYKAWIKKNWAS